MSRLDKAAAESGKNPAAAATNPAATSVKSALTGTRSARADGGPGAPSTRSSHTRATRSASAGNAGRPEAEHEPESRRRALPLAPKSAREGPRQRERPGQERQERHHQEFERAERHVLVRHRALAREAVEITVEERVAEEAGALRLHHQVPRQRDDGDEQHAPPRPPRAQRALAREPEEDRDDQQRAERGQE